MFAIIETGSKQYKVSAGDKIKVEKLETEKGQQGDVVSFDKVLLAGTDENDVQIGKPFISGAKVEAKVIRQGKNDKIIVFKYHSKSRYRKKKGHRQPFTELEITKITV